MLSARDILLLAHGESTGSHSAEGMDVIPGVLSAEVQSDTGAGFVPEHHSRRADKTNQWSVHRDLCLHDGS